MKLSGLPTVAKRTAEFHTGFKQTNITPMNSARFGIGSGVATPAKACIRGAAMNPKFAALVDTLAPKLAQLLAMQPLTYGALPRGMLQSGVYLFTEAGRHLYVGRSNALRSRYGRHCRPGATHRQAAFAFQLARGATGHTRATYRAGEGSRAGLMLNETFAAAFTAAKERILKMEYRYVEETDQNRQALLEIYCAVVLETPYNGFGTH
jgi:hypothetical protein